MSDEETPTTPEPPEATAAPEPTVEAPAEAPAVEAPAAEAPVVEETLAEAPAPPASAAEETVADAPTDVAAPVAAEPDGAPVAPVAPAPEPQAQPQPEPVAAMAPAPPAAEPKRRGVFVPAWVGAIVLVLIVAAVGFGVGRWTSDDSSTVSAPIANNGGIVPQLPNGNGNNGNGNNGNGGQNTPSTSTAFLGIATENATGGVAIVSVGDNTPADGAGLEEGDVITAVNDTDVSSPAELVEAIQSHDPGDQVTIHYTRDGDDESVRVTLGTRSQTNPN